MEITKWNVFFSETNHVSKDPKVLTEHIRINEHKDKDLKSPEITEIHITNKDISNDNVVVIKGYWIRLSEYNLWVEAFKNVEINPENRVLLVYIQGMSASETSTEDYYKGVIIFKEVEKTKELKLTGETTYKELEDFFESVFPVDRSGKEGVFTIGEYGAILLHRCIVSHAKDQAFIIKDNNFRNIVETDKIDPEPQFVKYCMPLGVTIKIIIKEHQSGMKIDETTGYPVESTILKFKEIIQN